MKVVIRTNLEHFRSLVSDEKGNPISIRQLTDEIGHTFEALRKFDRNETTRYSQDLLIKLCEYFASKGISCTAGDLIVTEFEEE